MQYLSRLVILFGLVALVGCGGGGPSGTGSGTVVMSMTDGPFPASEDCLSAARVVIDRVQLKMVEVEADGGEDSATEDDSATDEDTTDDGTDAAKSEDGDKHAHDHDADAKMWVDVPILGPDGTLTLDLLQLRAGVEATLALGVFPAGMYDGIRLHVIEAVLEFTDGSMPQPFKIPSGGSSGLKVKVDPAFEVVASETTSLVIDFDIGRSFHTTGEGSNPTCDDLKSGEHMVIFRPCIHAHVMSQGGTTTGTESGIVMGTVFDATGAPIGDVEVSAFPAGSTVDDFTASEGTTYASPGGLSGTPTGSYALYLLPGTYDLYLRAQSGGSLTLAASSVVVTSGATLTGQDLSVP